MFPYAKLITVYIYLFITHIFNVSLLHILNHDPLELQYCQ